MVLTEYLADVVHIKGEQNTLADCMSIPVLAVDVCDLPEIVQVQTTDNKVKSYPNSKNTSYQMDVPL